MIATPTQTTPLPAYVLATDGRLYRDPDLAGAGWALHVRGGQVRLVLDGLFWPERLAAIHAAGLRFRLLGEADYRFETLPGAAPVRLTHTVLSVQLQGPLPAALVQSGPGVWQPAGEHLLMTFGERWG